MTPTDTHVGGGAVFWDGVRGLWERTRGHPDVCVAILDGPVDRTHPALLDATLTESPPFTLDPHRAGEAVRHGTQIASIVFGRHDGPVAGIAPECRGVSVPIFADHHGDAPACTQAELAVAIGAALDAGAHVINVSAGEFGPVEAADSRLLDVVARCAELDVLLIAAAGAGGCHWPEIPGALPEVLAVGADEEGPKPSSRNGAAHGHCLRAPDRGILGAAPGGGAAPADGTSYATALVSGIAALLLSLQVQRGGRPDARAVRAALLNGARGVLDPLAAARLAVPDGTSGGRYVVRSDVLEEGFGGVPAERFGTVEVTLPSNASYVVPDLWYSAAGGRLGMRLVPVEEGPDGHHAVEAAVREHSGLDPADPIYALLAYVCPQEHALPLLRLPRTMKIQLGHRHLAGYAGGGRTTQALPHATSWRGRGPLDMDWNLDRAAATLYTIALHGVPQPVLNRNLAIVDAILATGTKEPEDTQNAACRLVDINTTLQFYRDCIRGAEYLRERTWFTNCAVHKTAVVNVAVNLPHNQGAFREIFGNDGLAVWSDFARRHEQITGTPVPPEGLTDFTPLWRLSGLTGDEVRPLSLGDYNTLEAARQEGWLDDHTGPQPLPPDVGLAWPLETLLDVVRSFVNTYAPFDKGGGLAAAALLLELRTLTSERLRAQAANLYLPTAAPFVTAFLAAETLSRGAGAEWLATAGGELRAWLGPLDSEAEVTLAECLNEAGLVLASTAPDASFNATAWLQASLADALAQARARLDGQDGRGLGHFASPSILHQVATGVHRKSPFITVSAVCTAMDAGNLTLANQNAIPRDEEQGMDEMLRNEQAARKVVVDMGAHDSHFPTSPSPIKDPEDIPPRPEQLVYALGRLDYDFPSRSRRDSLKQKMEPAEPERPADMLAYLDANPYDAAALQWTLNIEATPIYVIQPGGAFASETYGLLRQFLREQVDEGVERISVPGVIGGMSRHRSGALLPVLVPTMRGMYSWTTEALVSSLMANEARKKGPSDELRAGVTKFLERVYYEVQNFGTAPQERALNFAATNAFEAERVYEQAIAENLELDSIDVQASRVCPPGSDCWDVLLVFFFPERQVQTVRKVYRFTVDVADVVPVTVGPMRSWFIR